MDYVYNFNNVSLTFVSNDINIQIQSYLAASSGKPLLSGTNIDYFTVNAEKSSLPALNLKAYLEILINDFITSKYSKNLSLVTSVGSPIVSISSTTGLLAGMSVAHPDFAAGTTVTSVRDSTTLKLSTNATGTSTDQEAYISTADWDIDFSALDYLLSIIDFAAL
jgi:hypothetical protein